MLRVSHFEIMATDPDRAVKFYQDAFGWQIQKWDGPEDYWLVSTGEGEGINGGIGKSPCEAMVNLVVDVASVDDQTAKILSSGGTQIMPKMAIPGVGYVAYFKDSEGINFGIMQPDPNAA